MKKLMCAIAAVTAGLCYGSVESSNVVGYQNKEVEGGNLFNFIAPTFQRVDGKTVKLADFKLVYEEDNVANQCVWTLDQGGATKQDYYYVSATAAEIWEDPSLEGWYLDSNAEIPAGDVDIPYGTGFAMVAGDGVKIVFNGAVQQKEAAIDIAGGNVFNFTGNCIPVDYKLNDLSLVYEEDNVANQCVWSLDLGGATKQDYYYVSPTAAEIWEDPSLVGWYLDSNAEIPAEDVDLPAGAGFAIVCGDAIQLIVPSPLK